MSMIYVGNLKYETKDEELRELFSEFGKVGEIKDFFARGFGFVEMATLKEAEKAIQNLDNKEFLGRPINVSIAKARREYQDRGKS